MTRIVRADSSDEDFVKLVRQLDAYLAKIDGDEHAFYHTFNKIDLLNNVVVVYENEQPVSCGAFKEIEPVVVEVKRMYTVPAFRGKKFASAVLNELENWAAELGYEKMVLETGKRMPDAIAFYEKHGYKQTENYGQYIGVENSVCFRKKISNC